MSELKTLKDIEEHCGKHPIFMDLKAEAIKYYKFLSLFDNSREANDFIKHFFNITESELKNGI